MAKHRASILLLLALIGPFSVSAQTISFADLQGSWYFHQHFVDYVLFADADKPIPFPEKDYDMMKQQAAMTSTPLPDSATYAAMLYQNHENYRHYRIDFKSDSTYVTELAAKMSKWLPEKGQLTRTFPDGSVQMLDSFGTAVTSAITIQAGELHLFLSDPMFFGTDTPKLNRVLVFRRQQP
ncbi:MAG: hypothetical protein KDC01_07450 [Flavobacteriales bacterium]|nr:hypothetical protein [Flavobacteriales bacterium]